MGEICSYILLDAARMDSEFATAKALNNNFDSLYRGQSEETLASVAPYIFRVDRGQEFERWYFDQGWGDSWGVIVLSQDDMKSLHKHFRKFLMVQTEDGEELYFRFYDPRVLRVFLPTCDRDQLKEFFGEIDCFICEDENPEFGIVFSLQDGCLQQQQVTKARAMVYEPEVKKRRFAIF